MIPPGAVSADDIDALLPQTQCTQCGFAGCRPYAEAIARGETDINRCPPGGAAGIELGLDRVAAVKLRLGQRESCPVVLVGGTNGKGSTCAMLERILLAAGYRVGLYTSPHLLRYNERVRIDGAAVGDAELCQAFGRVEQARGDAALTYFEFGTLAAWEVFATAGLDEIGRAHV